MKRVSLFAALMVAAFIANFGFGASARVACVTDDVTESDITRQAENTPPSDNWVLYTRAGTPPTAGAFVTGPAAPPLGAGSLRFTTNTGGEKVFLFNYDHAGKNIGTVNAIEYSTYRTAGSAQQVTALNMQVDYNGPAAGGFTTLVFEPVYNTAQGAVVSGQWQTWNAFGGGVWWSTQPINGQCAGATATCDKTWAEIVANNPDAVILAFGVNQGSGNPGLITSVDKLTIGFTTAACPFVYDFEPDADNDGVGDGRDNCVNANNPDQADADGDGAGDACDLDDDNDGVNDNSDACPNTPAGTQVNGSGCPDADGDGVGDATDNCPGTPNPGQADQDGDQIGDACDSDVDGDGISNATDNCPLVANSGQADADNDGLGDACDADDDNDGVNDGTDACPNTPAGTQVNAAGCPVPTSANQCKNGGWQTLYRANNTPFKNQGDCMQYFNTGK